MLNNYNFSKKLLATDKKINNANKKITSNILEINTLKNEFINIDIDVATLKEDVVVIKGDITTIQGDVSTLQGDVSTLQSDIGFIQSDISTLQGDVLTIQGDVSILQDDVSDLKENEDSILYIQDRITNIDGKSGNIDAANITLSTNYQLCIFSGLTSYSMAVFDPLNLYIYITDNIGEIYKIRLIDGYYINADNDANYKITKWIEPILGAVHSKIIFDITYTYMYISSYGNNCIYKIRLSDGYFMDKDNIAYSELTSWISDIGLLYMEPVFDDTETYLYQTSYNNGCIYKIRVADGYFMDINNTAFSEVVNWVDLDIGTFASPLFDLAREYIYQTSVEGNCIYKIRVSDGHFMDTTGADFTEITKWISGVGTLYSSPLFDSTNTYIYQSCYSQTCIYKIRLSDGHFINMAGVDFVSVTKWASSIGALYAQPVIESTNTFLYQVSSDNKCIYKFRLSDGYYVNNLDEEFIARTKWANLLYKARPPLLIDSNNKFGYVAAYEGNCLYKVNMSCGKLLINNDIYANKTLSVYSSDKTQNWIQDVNPTTYNFEFTYDTTDSIYYIDKTKSKRINKTIIHNAPITEALGNYQAGRPVFMSGNVYKLTYNSANDYYEYIESIDTNMQDCIPSVKSTGIYKEYVGIVICTHEAGSYICCGQKMRVDININQPTIMFANGGDYLFYVTDSSIYSVGDDVLYDGTIVVDSATLTNQIKKSTIGTVTKIISTHYVSIFK
jgi:archaellum component FlaC